MVLLTVSIVWWCFFVGYRTRQSGFFSTKRTNRPWGGGGNYSWCGDKNDDFGGLVVVVVVLGVGRGGGWRIEGGTTLSCPRALVGVPLLFRCGCFFTAVDTVSGRTGWKDNCVALPEEEKGPDTSGQANWTAFAVISTLDFGPECDLNILKSPMPHWTIRRVVSHLPVEQPSLKKRCGSGSSTAKSYFH